MRAREGTILLIRLSSLGDAVLATGAIEALGRVLPGTRVDVLTRSGPAEVFRSHPGVGRVLLWEPSEGLAAVARQLRGRRYEWIIDLHGNLRTRGLQLLVPGPRWVRYRQHTARRRVAVWTGRRSLLPSEHVVDRYLGALAPLGVGLRGVRPRLYPGGDQRDWAAAALAGCGPRDGTLVAFAPGARWAAKIWPLGRWSRLAARVLEEDLATPVLLGGEEDWQVCEEIRTAIRGRGINLAGAATVLESAAVLERCAALVTNDSAPLHLANAVGTPVIALFGPTVPEFGFYPRGPRDRVLEVDLECRPCHVHGGDRCPLGHHRCLRHIAVERVFGDLLGAIRCRDGEGLEGRRKK